MPCPSGFKLINDTWLWRNLTLRLHGTLQHPRAKQFLGPAGTDLLCSRILFFGPFALKATPEVTLAEAQSMEFVRRHTTRPVPTSTARSAKTGRCTLSWRVYTLMEGMPGTSLDKAWKDKVAWKDDERGRKRVLAQLRSMFKQFQVLERPPGCEQTLCNVDGGPLSAATILATFGDRTQRLTRFTST